MNGARRERIRRNALLAPAALFVIGVALVPILFTFWLGFRREMPIFGISEWIGGGNYLFLFADARFWAALANTGYFVVLSVGLELMLGLAFAVLLHRTFRGRGLVWALVLVPWAVPNVVAARFWEWIFNADYGVFNYLLGSNIHWLGDPFWAIHAAILADVWKTTPFVVLLLLAGLQVIPEDLYRAARVDGANAWLLFRHVTLPLLRPYILLALLFRTVDAARVFDLIFVLTGGGPANQTETLVVYAYKLLYRTLQFGYGSAVAVATFFLVLAPSLGYAALIRRTWQLRGG
ncbi:MAG: sugar ABC transporter permease [Acidobacteria bacterium]|nr:sugar ABC transporter permease [Acidobacteriota bacterium]